MNTVKIDSKNTKLIAHRGLSGLECENTASAFVAAGNRGYYGIETDVHRTADGKYVVFHDDKTGRVCKTDISIKNSTLSELQNLVLFDTDSIERNDLRIPELKDYLRICKKYGCVAVLELKNLFDETSVKNIVSIVKSEYGLENTLFISFHYYNLVFIRRFERKAKIQFLCSCKVDEKLINSLKKYNFGVDIFYEFLNRKDVDILHSNGIEVNCWTVNSKKAAEELILIGVDYITTNILEKADV